MGEATNTLDIEGDIIKRKQIPKVNRKQIKATLKRFEGNILQRPPSFCALRKNNVRLYELARKDIYIRLKARPVFIKSIELLSFDKNKIDIEVVCGKGTYIRSLAEDICKEIGTVGHLLALKRISIGSFSKEKSFPYSYFLNESF